LVAANHVLVPAETHLKAFEGTDGKTLTCQKQSNRKLLVVGFLPCYEPELPINVPGSHSIPARWGKILPPIPRATAFADATESWVPLAVYDPKHPAVAGDLTFS